jgi:aminoglycoside phosphotransferase (APT) family kinase protein
VQDLVRAWVAGGGRSDEGAARGQVTAEGALGTCAGIAASLHLPVQHAVVLPGSTLCDGRARTLESEVDRVRASVESLSPYTPDLAAALRDRLDLVGQAAEHEPLPLLLAHGDSTPKEVLLDGPISAVFDLDGACAAEPALDLGHFAAHLALVVARASAGTAQPQPARGAVLQRLFLSEYLRLRPDLDPDAVLDRVAAYRVLALLEVAARSWHQLKPERLAVAVSLLERSRDVRHRTYT